MQGFKIFRLDREKGNVKNKMNKAKRGGGIIMYVKKGLSESTTILEYESTVSEDLEQLWIRNYSTTLAQNTCNGELTIVGDFNVNYNARNTRSPQRF